MHLTYRAVSFFFNDTATTEIYTLSLHDALPISLVANLPYNVAVPVVLHLLAELPSLKTGEQVQDRKSTRLNSSHLGISYAVFCLKKKNRLHTVPATDLARAARGRGGRGRLRHWR